MSPCLDSRRGWWAISPLAMMPVLAVAGLGIFLIFNGQEAAWRLGPGILLEMEWLPLNGRFGMAPLILGTLAATVLALATAVPLGVGVALYASLFASARVRVFAESLAGLLAGMPSVVIGLWGMTWIVPLAGNSLASAALVLAVMITPTFCLLALAAFRQVPAESIEAVRALGVSENALALSLIRHAWWGLAGAATLAACRGLGEAVALSMVAGNLGNMPRLLGPVATLTTTLIIEFDGATGTHRSALFLGAALVTVLITLVSFAARSAQRRGSGHG